jgi:hypothetical protein
VVFSRASYSRPRAFVGVGFAKGALMRIIAARFKKNPPPRSSKILKTVVF